MNVHTINSSQPCNCYNKKCKQLRGANAQNYVGKNRGKGPIVVRSVGRIIGLLMRRFMVAVLLA